MTIVRQRIERGGFLLFLALVSVALVAVVSGFIGALLWAGLAALLFQSLFQYMLRQVKERGQLDASASFNINDKLSLSVDAFNITNAERVEYENDPLKPRRADFDGRTFQFGVRALF